MARTNGITEGERSDLPGAKPARRGKPTAERRDVRLLARCNDWRMVRHQEDHAPQRGIIGGSTPHQAWLVAPSRAHTENLRTVERSIKMHKERLGAIGRSRAAAHIPPCVVA